MGYNKRNILERVILIQNVTLEHTKKGVSQVWVYNNIIYPRFMISYSCYNKYLSRNAKAELKELIERQNSETQLKLEF